jgi:hypothetical protein
LNCLALIVVLDARLGQTVSLRSKMSFPLFIQD